MTIIKRIGKLNTPLLQNGGTGGGGIDTTVDNELVGNGFGFVAPRNRLNSDIEPYYPPSSSYFVGENHDIKTSSDWSFSMISRHDAKFSNSSDGGGLYPRSKYLTNTPRLHKKLAFRFSIYIPTDGIKPSSLNQRIQILQKQSSDSPGFSIYIDYDNWFSIRFQRSGTDTIYCPVQQLAYNQWYSFIFFCDFEASLNGRCTVWNGQNLARIHPRVDGVFSNVPVGTGTGAYQRSVTLGDFLSGTVISGESENTLLDWKGFTLTPNTTFDQGQIDWGVYWGGMSQYTRTGLQVAAIMADTEYEGTYEDAVIINQTDPLLPQYLNEERRTFLYYSEFVASSWGEGQTDEDIFRELSVDGVAPLEFPVGDGAWPNGFVRNSPEPTFYDLTVTSTTGGSVSQSPSGTSFTAGTSITLTATALEGFVFSRYRNTTTNETLSTNAVYTFSKLASAQSIQAVFVASTPIPPDEVRFIARKNNLTIL
jgi:hypothetical protein